MKFSSSLRGISFVFLFIVPIIVGLFIFFDTTKPGAYTNLYLLPILSGVFFAILQLLSKNTSINFPLVCVIGLFYIRNVLASFALYMGEYKSYFMMITKDSIDSSIALLLSETVILSLYSLYLSKSLKMSKSIKVQYSSNYISYKNFLIIMLFTSVGLIMMNPNFLRDYTTIFSSQSSREMQIGTNATGPLYTLFTVILPITYLTLSVSIISFYLQRKKHYFIPVLVGIGIPFMFMSNADGLTLITVLCLGITVLKFNAVPKRMFASIGVVAMLLITINLFSDVADASFQSDQKSTGVKVSEIMQGYFPGVSNAAGLFTMQSHDKLETLFYDIYAAIPFRQTLFGIQGDNRLAYVFTNDNDASSQIIPCSAQFYYYLGFIGLLLECIFIKFAFTTYKKAEEETNIYIYYARILLFVYLIMTPTVYNMTIFLCRFFVTLAPLLLIYKALQGKQKTLKMLNSLTTGRLRTAKNM